MKRTFNYTERQRIDRKNVQIRLVDPTPEGTTIAVSVDISEYLFPDSSKVFIEAREESAFARRELENPFDPFWHDQFLINEFTITDSTKFLFRVVEAETTGRLLGFAEDIRLENPANTITDRDALLRVKWGPTGQEVWRLDCSDSVFGPTLYISEDLQPHFAQFSSDPMFIGCVVPQAFRRILAFALSEDDEQDIHDTEWWFHQWYRWMMSISDMRSVASRLDEGRIEDDDRESWINDAVEGFSKMQNNRFVSTVVSELNKGN